jgi:hypothetical protein
MIVWTQMKLALKENPRESWISARTWDRSADVEAQANTLSGLHSDYIIVVADETGGMPIPVLQSSDAILSSCKEGHVIQAGNPTHLACALHEATEKSGDMWEVITVTGDPNDPRRAQRVDIDWARDQIERWGLHSPFVRSKILGQYPEHATDALVGINHFEDAWDRPEPPSNSDIQHPRLDGLKALGVDIARFGADRSTAVKRSGDFLTGWDEWGGKDVVFSAQRAAKIALEEGFEVICVDDIGVGGGVTDILRRMAQNDQLPGIRIRPVNVGTKSHVRDPRGNPKFMNLKAELNFGLAKRLIDGELSIDAAFKRSTLQEEATDIRYRFAGDGKTLRIEDKEEYRKRHNGASPDIWDAAVLAFAAKQVVIEGATGWM